MHSRIEYRKRHRKIYLPSKMRIIMEEGGKIPHPYKVKLLNHKFCDFQALSTQFVSNHTKPDDGSKSVQWLNIKWMRF